MLQDSGFDIITCYVEKDNISGKFKGYNSIYIVGSMYFDILNKHNTTAIKYNFLMDNREASKGIYGWWGYLGCNKWSKIWRWR